MAIVYDQPAAPPKSRIVYDAAPPNPLTQRLTAADRSPEPADDGSIMADREQAAPSVSPEAAVGGLAGMPEGARRFWGGIKQLGGGLEDAWNLFYRGQKTNNAQQITDAENARQAAAQAAADKQGPAYGGGYQGGAGVAETALAAAPALATEGLASPATTLGGNVARQAAVGGATGGLAFSPTNDKGSNVVAGAALGAGVGTVGGLVSAARNYVAQAIRSTSARSEAAYQSAKDIMGWGTPESAEAGTDPTVAMRTGSPMGRSLEGQSFNARLQERYQRISDAFATRFREVFGLPEGTPPADIEPALASARQSAQSGLDGMKAARNKAYDDGMAQAQRLSDQVQAGPTPAQSGPTTFTQGGPPQVGGAAPPGPPAGARIQANNFSQQLRVSLDADQGTFGARVLPPQFLSDARRALAGGQGLSIRDTAGLLRSLTDMQSSDNPQLRAVAGRLRSAFEGDLDLVAQDSSGAHPAVQQVLQTRAAYKAASQQIENLQASATYRLLGVGSSEAPTPATLLSHYSSMEPAQQASTALWMRKNAPELFSQMRSRFLQDTASAGLMKAGPASASESSPALLIDAAYGDGQAVKASGLFNKQELENFEKFRQAARVIGNVDKGGGNAGTNIVPAEIGQNLVSQSPTFVARLIGRMVTAGKGDLFFSDPEAITWLTRINNTSGPKQAAAIAGYGAYLAQASGTGNGQGPAPAGR